MLLENDQLLLANILLTPLLISVTPLFWRHHLRFRHSLISLLIVILIFNIICISYLIPVSYYFLVTASGLKLGFRTEAINLTFALMSAILWLATHIYSYGYLQKLNPRHDPYHTRFYLFMGLSMSAAIFLALASNLLTLFIFYELLTLATWPLITYSASKEAMQAGKLYLKMLLFASMSLFLPAIVIIFSITGYLRFTSGGVFAAAPDYHLIAILLALFIFGTAKAALMPVHKWLPAAMVAPIPVSALLHAAAVVKAGVFTIIKIMFYIFGSELLKSVGEQCWWCVNWIPIAAGITIITASIIAAKHDNLKTMLAYSTIAQLGYCVLAASLMTKKALIAALLQMIAHAVAKISLFFAAGNIQHATNKTKISELPGMIRILPITMICFTICSLSLIGLPATAGFTSKYYTLAASDNMLTQFLVIIIVTTGTILTCRYLLPIIYITFWGKNESDTTKHLVTLPLTMNIAIIFTTLLVFAIYIYLDEITAFIEQAMI